METLASDLPANADNAAQGAATEVDSEVGKPEGDGAAPSVPEADTSAPKVKEDPVQKRINELTREKYDNARLADQRGYELERERSERLRLETEIENLRKAQTSQVAPDKFPTLEEYGYDEAKYQAAVAQHFTKLAEKQAETVAERKLNEARQADEGQRTHQEWLKRESEFIKSKPDYVDKVQNARTLPISSELQQILKGHEFGPQIAYHMVENAEASRAIARLPLANQIMEAGRIAERIAAQKAAPKPPVSQAPPPTPKVEGTAQVEKDPSQMTDAEFAKWRKRQIAQRR